MIRLPIFACVFLSLVGIHFEPVSAGLILQQPGPDIFVSGGVDYRFDSVLNSNRLMVGGDASQFRASDGSTQDIYFGTLPSTGVGDGIASDIAALLPGYPVDSRGFFVLDAEFNRSGSFASGYFQVLGYLGDSAGPTSSAGTVTLLKGTLREIDTALSDAGLLNFVADNLEGTLAGLYSGQAGIAIGGLPQGYSFTSTDFQVSSITADIGRPVPEPVSLAVWSSAIAIGTFGCRPRRRIEILPI